MEQLEVVNDKELDAILLHHPPRLGPQLQDRQPRAVVNEQRRPGQLSRRAGQLGKIPFRKKTVPNVPQIDPRARTEHAQHQRFGRHFQTEHSNRQTLLDGHVLRDIHRERRFAHARPRCDHNHFAPVETAGHLVQVGKPGRDAGQHPLPLMELLDRVDCPIDQVLDRPGARFDPFLADAQDIPLHFVKQGIYLALMLVDLPHHAGAGLNHAPQEMLLPHDVHVICQVRRRRHRVRQRRQVGQPAHRFELIAVLEPLLDREQINRFLVVVHFDQQLVNVPMAKIVIHLRTGLESLDAKAHAFVGRQQHATEHALLGFDRMRRQPVHPGRARGRLLLPACLLQIRRRAAGFVFNGINHGRKQRGFSASRQRRHTDTHQPRIDSLFTVHGQEMLQTTRREAPLNEE